MFNYIRIYLEKKTILIGDEHLDKLKKPYDGNFVVCVVLHVRYLRVWFITLLVYYLIAHQQPSQVGPDNGSLLLVGGGVTPEIGRQFIALAGGVEVPMVVIPTAGGATEYSQQTPVSQLLRQLGAKQVEVVHTNDRELASNLVSNL